MRSRLIAGAVVAVPKVCPETLPQAGLMGFSSLRARWWAWSLAASHCSSARRLPCSARMSVALALALSHIYNFARE